MYDELLIDGCGDAASFAAVRVFSCGATEKGQGQIIVAVRTVSFYERSGDALFDCHGGSIENQSVVN